MKPIKIEPDKGPILEFTGEVVAQVASSRRPRWTELLLYRTEGGNFICQSLGRSNVKDETTRVAAEVVKNHEEIQKYFGHSQLALELYEAAGIQAVRKIM